MLYDDLANDLTIGMLLSPAIGRDIEATEVAEAVQKELDSDQPDGEGDRLVRDHLVRDNGELLGTCTWVDLMNQALKVLRGGVPGSTVRDCAQLIPPNRIVSTNTPFTRAVHLFAKESTPYYVLGADQIVGIFRPRQLLGPRAIFCYLALTLELETAALNLCTWFPEAFETLPTKRHDEAKKVYKDKMEKMRSNDWQESWDNLETPEFHRFWIRDMMQSTNLCDKATMITKSKLLIDQSNTRIRDVFGRAQRVRNACVHPFATDEAHPERWSSEAGDLFDMSPAKLSGFIRDCLDMIESIRTVIPVE